MGWSYSKGTISESLGKEVKQIYGKQLFDQQQKKTTFCSCNLRSGCDPLTKSSLGGGGPSVSNSPLAPILFYSITSRFSPLSPPNFNSLITIRLSNISFKQKSTISFI